jgi:hypothetical protein
VLVEEIYKILEGEGFACDIVLKAEFFDVLVDARVFFMEI